MPILRSYRILETVAGGQSSPYWECQEGHPASTPRNQKQSVPGDEPLKEATRRLQMALRVILRCPLQDSAW